MSRPLALLMLFLPLVVGAENVTQPKPVSTSAAQVEHQQVETSPLSTDGSEAALQKVQQQRLNKKLQANVVLHSLDELKHLLIQAEKISNGESEVEYSRANPIAVVLYGEEIQAFVRSNYRTHKKLVDLAARLDAFNVIEVKVCQQWMAENGIKPNELPPFVEPVPVGAGERARLEKTGYAYF